MPSGGLRLAVGVTFLALVVGTCGAGGLDEALEQIPVTSEDGESSNGDGESGTGDGASDEQTSGSGGTVGPVTATADPGQAWAKVDGERIVYTATGSLHYTCEVQPDSFNINYQTAESHDFSMSASDLGDGWSGRMTFKPGGGDNVQYSAVLPRDGSLGVGDGAVSYEGTVERIQDFDPATATKLDVRVAVNCGSGGDDPTAVFGDRTITAPFSGAGSVDCTVSQHDLEVTVNRLGQDDTQIDIDGSFDGESWLGSVSVIDGDDRYLSTMPADGQGLEIDGTSVNYEGSFTHTSESDPDLEEEVEGTVTVNCP